MDTASTKANADADAAIAMFGGSVAALPRDEGRVRMTADGRAGHEHFGFADGVSQPGIAGLTLPVAEGGGQCFPGQDLLAANRFVLDASAPAAWMQNGSYMVFRRLNQDVPRFKDYTRDNWTRHSASEERFAASIVGRWADGSALARNARAPEPTEDEEHPEKNNAFEFGKDDPKQLVCPFAAHVRRVYPRQDLLNDSSEDHRIIRAGIAFGADDADDKGLLFVCYQSSIEQQFAFIQKSWANSATFPFTPGAPIEPTLEGPPEPGIDLLIGQTLAPRSAFWATGELRDVPTFVHATGAAYLFSPSKSGLKHLAGV
jgi:Dyp-type peroxidase family